MFQIEEIPPVYTEDYKTLHHDIGLVRRSNGLWDLWFGQDEVSENFKDSPYLDIVEGDIVSATEIHSLQVAIIISCLTSWNYLNRTHNPIYTEFGNKSYSLLKKNKGVNTRYKIKHFFIECLKRMRRVYDIEYLNVYDVANNPYVYRVNFKVLSVTNTIVDGEFYLNVDTNKNTSMINLNYNHPYTSVSNPLFIECELRNEYGSPIENEILYVYMKNDGESKFKFYGITEATNEYGNAYITIPPRGLNINTKIMFIFKGNALYNPCRSKIISIQTVAYFIKSRFTHKNSVDDTGKESEVIDKQILYVEDSMGDSSYKFRLGELLSDYINIENLPLEITEEYIQNNLNENTVFDYDENEIRKLYLVPTDRVIEGTNKVYYKPYVRTSNGLSLYPNSENPSKVQLNTNDPYEVHFLIEESDNGLFEIDFGDGHLYYQIELIDDEE